MASPFNTSWTGKPELHKIVDSSTGRTHYFFDTPQVGEIGQEGYNQEGYSSSPDLNQIRADWNVYFPGVPFPDPSAATVGTGINAQGNGTPGTFNGQEMTERGNAGHGSWMDQQGGELISDALFAGAGYVGGPIAAGMMSYGLGGDTSAESQRSLRSGAAGGIVGSIFGTPSTSASNTPADASSVPTDSGAPGGTISGSEGNPTMTGGAGNDTLPGSDPYGTGVDANGNPTGQYANGTSNSLNLGNSNFWGPVGSALISGYLGSQASREAARTVADATRGVADTQRGIYDQIRTDLDPYRQAGMPALQQLMYLTGLSPTGANGSTGGIVTDPSYQFRKSEGEKALTRGYAARGLAQSTPGMKSLINYNQDLASTEYGNTVSRLMSIAGVGQNAAAGTASAGISTGNTAANAAITGAQASAAGITGSASAYNNAIQGGLSNYLYQQRFDQMMQRMPVFNSSSSTTAAPAATAYGYPG